MADVTSRLDSLFDSKIAKAAGSSPSATPAKGAAKKAPAAKAAPVKKAAPAKGPTQSPAKATAAKATKATATRNAASAAKKAGPSGSTTAGATGSTRPRRTTMATRKPTKASILSTIRTPANRTAKFDAAHELRGAYEEAEPAEKPLVLQYIKENFEEYTTHPYLADLFDADGNPLQATTGTAGGSTPTSPPSPADAGWEEYETHHPDHKVLRSADKTEVKIVSRSDPDRGRIISYDDWVGYRNPQYWMSHDATPAPSSGSGGLRGFFDRLGS